MLGYSRLAAVESTFHTFWFQCSQDGWDPHAGSKFTLEFQDSSEPKPGTGRRRFRFLALLTPGERDEVRSLQNQVIKKLRPPPQNHWVHTLDASTRKWYFAKFDLIRDPLGELDDVWMRYADEADVRRWADFLVSVLPQLIENFTARTGVASSGA
jgi:hypothetical protein